MSRKIISAKGPVAETCWACGECGQVRLTPEAARQCCAVLGCAGCEAPIQQGERYYTLCRSCRGKADAEKEAAKVETAEKVDPATYTGPVHVDDEEYYETLEDLLDRYAMDPPDERPAYAWPCTVWGLAIDADHVIESALQDHYDEADECIGDDDRAALQVLLDDWARDHGADVKTWEPESKRVILLGAVWATVDAERAKREGAAP